jgi:gentisate 1,2-dioxygenase
MELPNFEAYQRRALGEGFDAVLERDWAPGTVLDVHTHPFSAQALVVRGEMWLTVGTQTRHLRAGDTFSLALEEPHAERYGPEGATYWVARRGGGT